MYNTWTYRSIEPTSLIEFDLAFTDATGERVDPPPGVPRDVRHLVTFTPLPSGRTLMTVTEFGYPEERVRDQSKAGLEPCLDMLAVGGTAGATLTRTGEIQNPSDGDQTLRLRR